MRTGRLNNSLTVCIASIFLLVAMSLSSPAFTLQAQTSTHTVTGNVTDESGEVLIGASVYVKGTSIGVSTNSRGNYTITIPNSVKNPVLHFSFIGMKGVDRIIGTNNVINVKMLSDTQIESVVVTGYGVVQRKEDLTGSAFAVTADKLELMPASRADNLLDGLVPGLRISAGAIGNDENIRSRLSIRIRGDESLSASSDPLWIIDGAPFYTGNRTGQTVGTSYTVSPMGLINPEDIESITVLKDASTTALYGADGANGVVLITTKQGSQEKMRLNASVRFGVTYANESTRFKVLNASQYMAYAQEAWTNAGYPLSAFPYQDSEYNSYSTTDTKWNKVYMKPASTVQVNVNGSGGNKFMRNYVSLGYYSEDYILKGNDQKRLTINTNSTFNLSKRLSANIKLQGAYSVNNIFYATRDYYTNLPIFEPYNPDGSYRLYNYYSRSTEEYKPELVKFFSNGVPERDENDNRQRTIYGNINTSLKYDIIKGLSATVQFTASYNGIHEDIYYARTTLDGWYNNQPAGISRRGTSYHLNWTNINRINFDRTFGKHHVSALIGLELKHDEQKYNYVQGWGFINDNIKEIAYVSGENVSGSSNTTFSRSLSFLGQAKYIYDGRYAIEVTGRRQGYSGFGRYSRWGNFASVSGAWNIHNEHFFHSDVIDTLRAKISYGNSGNSKVDTSAAYGTYSTSTSNSYNGVIGGVQSSAANHSLSWETTHMLNTGVSIGILKRVMVDVEYYHNYTTNMLADSRVSMVTSDGAVMQNIGEMVNQGIEINLTSTNIDHRNFKWKMDFNLSHNSNRIVKLYEGIMKSFGEYVYAEGYPKNMWYLIRWAGVDPADGTPMWYDKAGNITKVYNYDNRVATGKLSVPTVYGSLTNTFHFKDMFSLRVMLNYAIGGWQNPMMQIVTMNAGYDIIESNTSVNALNHWRKPGDLNANPKVVYKNNMKSGSYSDRFLTKMTNIRLQNITLTYHVPESFCQKLRMKGISVSLVGDNIYVWTPDQKRGKNSYKTMMNAGYPMQTSYSMNLSLTF